MSKTAPSHHSLEGDSPAQVMTSTAGVLLPSVTGADTRRTMGLGRRWVLWLCGTVATLPVSYVVWWFWGMGFCGEEVYDTPPGSTGDAICAAMIEPVWPWALVASTPTLLALVGGFVALQLRSPRLLRFALLAPFSLGVLTLFLAPALF
jgi:hypothetical protein